MNTEREGFLPALTSLWLRLSTVAMVALFVVFALQLHTKILGWSFYLNATEMLFEAAVYAVFVALTGVALGLIGAIAVAPFLFFMRASRPRIVQVATKGAVGVAAFLDFWVALQHLPGWSNIKEKIQIAIFACYLLGFIVALCIPRRRHQLVTSLDDYLGQKSTRRAVIGTGLAAAGLVMTEAAISKTAFSKPAFAATKSNRVSPPSGPNILLVTFDALSAEDMSVYGYRLPTTPNMEEFARKSTIFSNFYSASTFTTPCITSILTGRALSEHQVYQLTGELHTSNIGKTLPHVLRSAGYTTGASISNPFAYFLAQGIGADYDYLPEPTYRTADFMRFWDATHIFHQTQPFGSRAAEFEDLQNLGDSLFQDVEQFSPRLLGHTVSGFPPSDSFNQARQVLEKMPEGFFMWVHVLAPHAWYLPKANLGRFLPSDDLRTAESQNSNLFPSEYPPERQGIIDKARLRYNEFLADTDHEFGAFISGLEKSGKLRNTAVIVSADHGESFVGGFWGHGGIYQTRPEIHIPLMIRTPGQERGSRVAVAADQTSLAPTVLELAGLPRPEWMRSPSLLPWLNSDSQGNGQGLAFTQYLETNSIFKPLHHGSVGVIDGRNQYILNLSSGKGILRGLAEAQSMDLDRSAADPALAQSLRDAIYARFPSLPRENS